jgi:hypothetical protein
VHVSQLGLTGRAGPVQHTDAFGSRSCLQVQAPYSITQQARLSEVEILAILVQCKTDLPGSLETLRTVH